MKTKQEQPSAMKIKQQTRHEEWPVLNFASGLRPECGRPVVPRTGLTASIGSVG